MEFSSLRQFAGEIPPRLEDRINRIEVHGFGLRLNLQGFRDKSEIGIWLEGLERVVGTLKDPYGLLIDARGSALLGSTPSSPSTDQLLSGVLRVCQQSSLERVAIVLEDAVGTVKAWRSLQGSRDELRDRFLNADQIHDWERRALDWILHGRDPNRRREDVLRRVAR